MSAIILLIPFLFNVDVYTPYYDFASLLCVQQWIFETNSSFKFLQSLFLTVAIMFAQSFTLNLIFFNENIFSNFENLYQAFLYAILTFIFANPITIKYQDRLAAQYESFPYSVMMIDKVGQALTISKLIEAFVFYNITFTNLQFILSTIFMSQIPILVLFIGLRDYHSNSASYSKIKDISLENSIIYLLTSLIFLFLRQTNLIVLDPQTLQYICIILFVLLSTFYYQIKKIIKSKNQSKIKTL
ncbi:unnamed protein product [Paramecium sonneborni]|uniref:Uncharacterized protein n=1 Tax=Paramecium sonneborni TaxID=65129 RepID=A0A8S1KRK7_9CILI|nr:unnamed protein product [Paramecium sonneborni]